LHQGRLVAEGTPEELAARHGGGTLEDVFMTLTGRRLDDADATDTGRST
jgi:ABC-type Na+ transport system ATPase subunit NatA